MQWKLIYRKLFPHGNYLKTAGAVVDFEMGVLTPLWTMIKELVKKFVALLTKEKQLRMNGKMMTLNFLEVYSVSTKK